MRGLDDYIMGVNVHFDEVVLHRCPKCGLEQRLAMYYELGGWFYSPESEDDAFCKKCDCELDIIEETNETQMS